MAEKLRIAKYNGNVIDITEYHDSIHKGRIYCPFCKPPLKLVHVVDGFFRAWPNQGGHNCGRIAVKIFEADWKGREITNIIRRQNNTLEIVIDIFQLAQRFRSRKSQLQYKDLGKGNIGNKEYPKYEHHKEVFRDVVRSVYQMKQLIEQNEIDSLKAINFRFTTENEIVPLDEVLKVIDELDKNLIDKSRFVVFKVESTKLSDKIIFINAYRTNSKDLSIVFRYPDKLNKFKKLENGYAIAYGNISYSRGKFFVNIVNDFHIQSLDEDSVKIFFEGKELEKYNKKHVISETRDLYIHNEIIKADLLKNDMSNYSPGKKEINSVIQSEALVEDNKGLSMHVSKTEFVLNKTQEVSDKNTEYEKVSIIKKVVNSIFSLLKNNN
ncbi:hypothetical protein [Desulfosporosinus shakirovi]|uniref:hypothetical protein n=1 Tax=Desulfosporosinus shakirovi TaxID=2885154 RepID=UPI001E3F7665|nr:hypothetical protein [Desulfosporosinus sp. SRJS8]MCB8817393.1 hypothetical protein [Desulfosporosinus sp. SRJS8]